MFYFQYSIQTTLHSSTREVGQLCFVTHWDEAQVSDTALRDEVCGLPTQISDVMKLIHWCVGAG